MRFLVPLLFFSLATAEPVRVLFDSDGHCLWSRDWAKAHRYVKIQGSPKALTGLIGELMSNAPQQRRSR